MKVVVRRINELIPYEYNNKIHTPKQIEQIARSIKEFGFLQPVVIDEVGNIIAGHARVEALKSLGEEFVEVVVAENLTEEKVKLFRILDNKLSSDSSYNFEHLRIDFEALSGLDLFEDFELDDWKLNEEIHPSASASVEELDSSEVVIKVKVLAKDEDEAVRKIEDALESYHIWNEIKHG